MRGLDFSSIPSLATTLFGLVLFSLVAVGVRLLFMQTVQRRRERENRQINERLRTLMAAYKTLGSSFTGELTVDPVHRREQRRSAGDQEAVVSPVPEEVAERRRRVRDAVEAALSDVILLGTEEQVRLAARAAQDMVAGRVVHTAELVASLRHSLCARGAGPGAHSVRGEYPGPGAAACAGWPGWAGPGVGSGRWARRRWRRRRRRRGHGGWCRHRRAGRRERGTRTWCGRGIPLNAGVKCPSDAGAIGAGQIIPLHDRCMDPLGCAGAVAAEHGAADRAAVTPSAGRQRGC